MYRSTSIQKIYKFLPAPSRRQTLPAWRARGQGTDDVSNLIVNHSHAIHVRWRVTNFIQNFCSPETRKYQKNLSIDINMCYTIRIRKNGRFEKLDRDSLIEAFRGKDIDCSTSDSAVLTAVQISNIYACTIIIKLVLLYYNFSTKESRVAVMNICCQQSKVYKGNGSYVHNIWSRVPSF